MAQKVEEYRGHAILITDALRFRVEFGPDDSALEDTAKALRAVIDDRLKSEAKATKLNLPVLTREGAEATVTGLHMGTSNMIGKGLGADAGRYRGVMYPVASWVREALVEAKRLREELGVVENRLEAVAINSSVGYGRCTAEEYSQKIEKFKAAYAEATTRARDGGN